MADMKLLGQIVLPAVIAGIIAFTLTDGSATFRTSSAVGLNESAPHEDLETAREPTSTALTPDTISELSQDLPGSELSIELPVGESYVRFVADAPTKTSAELLADRAAQQTRDHVVEERQAEIDAIDDDLESQLLILEDSRAELQSTVDEAILSEAEATAAVLGAGDEDERDRLVQMRDRASSGLREVAAIRDDVADARNRVIADRFERKIERELLHDVVYVIPALSASDRTASPTTNGAVAALLVGTTFAAVSHVLRRRPGQS
jgi:hypothetical protein